MLKSHKHKRRQIATIGNGSIKQAAMDSKRLVKSNSSMDDQSDKRESKHTLVPLDGKRNFSEEALSKLIKAINGNDQTSGSFATL